MSLRSYRLVFICLYFVLCWVQVVTAVKFLQNPKVRQSPLSQKKAFLESKGVYCLLD